MVICFKSYEKKIVILGGLVVATLLAGSVLLTMQKRGQQEVMVQEPKSQDSVQTKSSSPANWKTYSNTEYGFEIKYPQNWVAEEFFSAGIGAPFDCKVTPDKCKNFSVKFSSPDKTIQPIVLETSQKVSGEPATKNSDAVESPTWGKNISGQEFTKSNSYFPMFDSCFTTAGVKNVKLKNDVNFHFFTFYEPKGSTAEAMEKSCFQEIPDETFDKIVGSFTVTK